MERRADGTGTAFLRGGVQLAIRPNHSISKRHWHIIAARTQKPLHLTADYGGRRPEKHPGSRSIFIHSRRRAVAIKW